MTERKVLIGSNRTITIITRKPSGVRMVLEQPAGNDSAIHFSGRHALKLAQALLEAYLEVGG